MTPKRKLTQKQLDQSVLMFAFGSNMTKPRLAERIGRCEIVGTYELQDFKLTFDVGSHISSYANVRPCPGDWCEGVIYELTYGQLRILDRYEALYQREHVMYEGRRLHFYRSHFRPNQWSHLSREYYSLVKLGCLEHKLEKSLAILQEYESRPALIDWKRERLYKGEYD